MRGRRGGWPLAALLCLSGCFEVEREVELCPDGSGRVRMRVVAPGLLQRLAPDLPRRIQAGAARVQGVRWRPPARAEDGATLLVGYFADIRQVRGHGVAHALDLAEDGGLRLVIRRGDPAGGPGPLEQVPPGVLESGPSRLLVSRLFASLRVSERVVLPAPLRAVSQARFTARLEGRPGVETHISGADLGDLERLRAALDELGREPLTLECEPPAPGAARALADEVQAALAELPAPVTPPGGGATEGR